MSFLNVKSQEQLANYVTSLHQIPLSFFDYAGMWKMYKAEFREDDGDLCIMCPSVTWQRLVLWEWGLSLTLYCMSLITYKKVQQHKKGCLFLYLIP